MDVIHFNNKNKLKIMGVKKRFIEMIKSGYPSFNPENDSVEIEFEGGGDSFGSFSYISVYPHSEGNVNLEDFFDLLMEILYESGVEYNWNNAGTTGTIRYNESNYQELSVYTIVSEEYWGEISEDDEEPEHTSTISTGETDKDETNG